MTVLIDAPLWPAHGTLWSHLVSDSSLDELHAFAARAGLGRRAFDLDHYDVPEARYAELVAAGARPTDRRELLRRLATSGLRVAGRDRTLARRDVLLGRWDTLLPGATGLGADLLDRWSEPHRAHHGTGHLTHVLDSLVVLDADAPRAVGLALWFHDAVHDGVAGADEEASAELAEQRLAPLVGRGLSAEDVAETARLVRLTATHDPAPDDHAGALVCDADLAVLAGAPDRYARYVRQVREEYRDVPDAVFAPARAQVLAGLLAAPSLFRTAVGASRWEEAARRNLTGELARLTATDRTG